jgi:hypothetical protein
MAEPENLGLKVLRILFAYVVAVLAGAAAVTGLALILFLGLDRLADAVFVFMTVSVVIGAYAAFPSMIAVLFAETTGIKKLVYYAVVGMLIGFFVGAALVGKQWFPFAGLGCGLIAGVVFWKIAGRHAGGWRRAGS